MTLFLINKINHYEKRSLSFDFSFGILYIFFEIFIQFFFWKNSSAKMKAVKDVFIIFTKLENYFYWNEFITKLSWIIDFFFYSNFF